MNQSDPRTRSLLRPLQAIRKATILEPAAKGTRMRRQLEELPEAARRLAACFNLLPSP